MRSIKERKKKAIGLLAQRLLMITFIAVLALSGVWHFDKFQATKVVGPLIGLELLNADIRYEIEQEATLNGYTDTTGISNRIQEMFDERREEYYNNEDEVISFVTSSFSLLKILYFLISLFLIIAVTGMALIMFYGFYWQVIHRFKRSWKRIKEREKEERKEQRRSRIAYLSDYQIFDDSVCEIR
jgi:flagellar basal body-associated protein FliL